ncbi:RHS repeat protein [Salmonella enterica subsp. enterica]|nr:RHS repeat protein [Salmonella enterica subsp. enterica]
MNETFSTQAHNFVSALSTGTDPRTGQFLVNFPLASLSGNAMLGPHISLGLSYSPLVSGNCGFGTGFSLGLSQFNNKTNLLELSSGEKYRVIPGSDEVRNHKLASFRFAYTNGTDDADGYTVFWKEGKQELLTLTGENTFVTSLITSPLGRTLVLNWDWSGQYPRLSCIRDENNVLCQFEYDSDVIMTVWPGTSEEYRLLFEFINFDQLDSVSRLAEGDKTLTWYFLYDAVDGQDHLVLTGVNYPTGMMDRVEYSQIEGFQFPDSSGISSRLPAVLSHTRRPGGGQPDVIKYYTYSEQNFLGYNGNFGDWSADSDYIYTTLTDYTYSSTETVSDAEVTVTTERTYNNYHLQVCEEVSRGGCTHRTEYEYYAEQDSFIDSQPPQFQLPKNKKETWTDNEGKNRTLETLTEFDKNGNPVYQLSPDGTETVTEWYAAEGEEGCPAEPNGFVRFMKSQTVTPRQTEFDTPVMQSRYTYKTAGSSEHIVQDTEAQFADDELLQKQTYDYNITPGDAEYGRITGITHEKYQGGESSSGFVSSQLFTTMVNDGILSQTTLFTGYDFLQATTVRMLSAFSGLLLNETDAQGVTVAYTYDKTGRLLTRTTAAGTDYANIATWDHLIETNGPVTKITDSSGNQRKLCFDGAGRQILEQIYDTDTTHQWYSMASRSLNTLGEVVKSSGYDHLTSPTPEGYTIDASAQYDDWGTGSIYSYSDGTVLHQNDDPVNLKRTVFLQGNRNGETQFTGKKVTLLDEKSLLPANIQEIDISNNVFSCRQLSYDGLGRLILETDELGNTTRRTYDSYNRVLTQTLSDGSIVSRTYPPHLTGNQVATISVKGPDAAGNTQTWILGTQEFDGLARLTKQTSGGRTTVYHYTGASPLPDTVTLPSGSKITYQYIPELNNAVSSVEVDGIIQSFIYDKVTGKVLQETEGKVSTDYLWNISGTLAQENFSRDNIASKTAYTHTISGAPASYNDVAGCQTTYKRDEFGRVISILDKELKVSLEYDVLGRLTSQTVMDSAETEKLTTIITYDDFGREINRTIDDNTGSVLITELTWKKNGLLEFRSLKTGSGEIVRKEEYKYDSRNRLIKYIVSGTEPVPDAYGNPIATQTCTFDALNNLTEVITTLTDQSVDVTAFHYDNKDDPTQLTSVTHSHPSYPSVITLEYDAEGRMTRDESGRSLTYDSLGRLSSVDGESISGGVYGYDARNRLVSQQVNEGKAIQLYYRGNELVNEATQ